MGTFSNLNNGANEEGDEGDEEGQEDTWPHQDRKGWTKLAKDCENWW